MEQTEDSHRSQRRNERLSRGRTLVVPSGAVIFSKKRTDQFPLDLAMEIVLVTLMLGCGIRLSGTEDRDRSE